MYFQRCSYHAESEIELLYWKESLIGLSKIEDIALPNDDVIFAIFAFCNQLWGIHNVCYTRNAQCSDFSDG